MVKGGVRAVSGPTYLEGPASSVLVVVADPLQLAASRQLPDDELQAPPQKFTVEEHEELGHRSEGGGGDGSSWTHRQVLGYYMHNDIQHGICMFHLLNVFVCHLFHHSRCRCFSLIDR